MRMIYLMALMILIAGNAICPSVRYNPTIKDCIILVQSSGHVDFSCNNVLICSE